MPYDSPERREVISRSLSERIEISRVRISGRRRIDIRIFQKSEAGYWTPKSGLAIRMSEVAPLSAALVDVVKPTPVLGDE
jgi:hypothetical protein